MSAQEQRVQETINLHCISCHAAVPSDAIFTVAPVGLKLDIWQHIQNNASKIYNRTVITKDMPLMNKTKMTAEERQLLGDWFLTLE